MRRGLVVLALALLFPALSPAQAGSPYGPARIDAGGGVEGGDALWLPMGDLLNVRNIQGGFITDDPGDLNLDLGAGNSVERGDIVLNWDVGRRTLVYDGEKRLVAKFAPNRVVFYVPVKFKKRKVPLASR